MGQRRVSETVLGTVEVSELMAPMSKSNVTKNLTRDLREEERTIKVHVDEKGRIQGQQLFVGSTNRPTRVWGRDYVESFKAQYEADEDRRAADARRRQSARTRSAA